MYMIHPVASIDPPYFSGRAGGGGRGWIQSINALVIDLTGSLSCSMAMGDDRATIGAMMAGAHACGAHACSSCSGHSLDMPPEVKSVYQT